jgi:hypothetical protein
MATAYLLAVATISEEPKEIRLNWLPQNDCDSFNVYLTKTNQLGELPFMLKFSTTTNFVELKPALMELTNNWYILQVFPVTLLISGTNAPFKTNTFEWVKQGSSNMFIYWQGQPKQPGQLSFEFR